MKSLLLLTAFAFCHLIQAQTSFVKGQILDKQSDLPLLGVTVELLNQETPKGTIIPFLLLIYSIIRIFLYGKTNKSRN